MKAANGLGTYEGFCTVQVKFDYSNAKAFVNPCNAIFDTNYEVSPPEIHENKVYFFPLRDYFVK